MTAARRRKQGANGGKRRLVKLKRLGFWCLLISVLAYSVFSSKYFELGSVQIKGTRALMPRDVLMLLDVKPEQKFYFFSMETYERKLKAHPKIRNAHARTEFPHTLRISLEERKPLFAVPSKEASYILDEDRVVMEKIPVLRRMLPLVQGVDVNALPGQKLEDRRFLFTVQCLKSSSILSPQRISKFVFEDSEMVLYTDKGLKVKLGDGRDVDKKLKRLKVVMQLVRKKNLAVKYIDLQSMDRPAIGIEKQMIQDVEEDVESG